MSLQTDQNIVDLLNKSGGCTSLDNTKAAITNISVKIKRYQESIRKYIEDNYVDFVPNFTSSDLYLEEGNTLIEEVNNLMQTVVSDANKSLREANVEFESCVEQFQEYVLGLRVAHRILKVDDLFQNIGESNLSKEYLVVLDLLSQLNSLICVEGNTDVERAFKKCECYNNIQVKYHIQLQILKQNLQQRFENLVQFIEKPFPHSKAITIKVSKDTNQLQDTIMALFQARYNLNKMCDFLYENCLEPIVIKPVSIEYSEENESYYQLTLSYSLRDLVDDPLRPLYKQVFENIKILLQCLSNINVLVSDHQHVFSIIGDHIKKRLLKLIVDECLMNSIPETMDDLQKSTLIEDVLEFEHALADTFFINVDNDHELHKFTENFQTYFSKRFCKKLLISARETMQKDLQDMTLVAEKNTPEDIGDNVLEFQERCMISRSTLDLIKLMEWILRQPQAATDVKDNAQFTDVITSIINSYVIEVPKIHATFLESIPQQSVLFYNNCMFLSHWVAKNTHKDKISYPELIEVLRTEGTKYLNIQIVYQQKIIMGILKELDFSHAHSIGSAPLKLMRQCLRQLDLLRNVWQTVMTDDIYNKTFCNMLNDVSSEIIKRILAMEDISTTVANELSSLIELILEKGPTFFKDKHSVVQIQCWMKLEQLKTILNASLIEITELWCGGAGILTANYKAEEVKHLIRALFQNTDYRANALAKIIFQ